MESSRQFVKIVRPSVGQSVVHLVPDGFVGVEFRRIGRKTLQVDSRELAAEFTPALHISTGLRGGS